jgi:hypothetical protein
MIRKRSREGISRRSGAVQEVFFRRAVIADVRLALLCFHRMTLVAPPLLPSLLQQVLRALH